MKLVHSHDCSKVKMLSVTSFYEFVSSLKILIDNKIWNHYDVALHGLHDVVFIEVAHLELWTTQRQNISLILILHV